MNYNEIVTMDTPEVKNSKLVFYTRSEAKDYVAKTQNFINKSTSYAVSSISSLPDGEDLQQNCNRLLKHLDSTLLYENKGGFYDEETETYYASFNSKDLSVMVELDELIGVIEISINKIDPEEVEKFDQIAVDAAIMLREPPERSLK